MKVFFIILSLFWSSSLFYSVPTHINNSGFISKNGKVFNIEDYKWLVGSWKGDGFGGTSEETWSVPANGTMMGMYRHIKDGKVVFYEFLLLDETGIKLKHFHPDLKGWEEKNDMTSFEMINFSPVKIEMKGLIFEKKSDDLMEIRLRLRQGNEVKTEVFTMHRVK